MLRYLHIFFTLMVSLSVLGQGIPSWIDPDKRAFLYPASIYITGYAEDKITSKDNATSRIDNLKQSAQANLIASIRVRVESEMKSVAQQYSTQSTQSKAQDYFSAIYQSAVKTTATAEIVGMKVETYHDKIKSTIYALAYVNRSELIAYYENNIQQGILQATSYLNSAKQFENNKLKVKAKEQCRQAIPFLAKIAYAQDMLMALDKNANEQILQIAKSEQVRNDIIQLMTNLEQNVYVYINSKEELFGKPVFILTNKLKALLAQNGCSFIEDPSQADYSLNISATTRPHDANNPDFKYTNAEVQINLYSTYKQKNIYTDEIEGKGGALTYETAGRKALEDCAKTIWEKIKLYITN